MKIKNLPTKYEALWAECIPLLEQGRPGDAKHAAEVVTILLEHKNTTEKHLDVLIPVAMMHDIGHAMILPQHFKYVTGGEKLINGKLVHMLVGAKIAKDLLDKINYDKNLTDKIVEIISMHDADQLKEVDTKKIYTTEERKIFHDVDSLDRFTQERIDSFAKLYKDKDILSLLESTLKNFFYDEFRNLAKKQLEEIKKNKT